MICTISDLIVGILAGVVIGAGLGGAGAAIGLYLWNRLL